MSVAAHVQEIYAKSTSAAAIAGDMVDGIDSATFSETADMVDTNYIGGSGYKSRVATLKDTRLSISGHYKQANAPQALIRSSFASGATVYMTVMFDDSVAAGSKGKQVPMIVESFEESLQSGGLVTWSAELAGNGTPVNV